MRYSFCVSVPSSDVSASPVLTSAPRQQVFINLALAINNAVDPSQRGTINGLSMMLGSLATATGPTVFSTIFAWSINRHHPFPLDHHLSFTLLALGMVVVTATSWNFDISPGKPEPRGPVDSPEVVSEKVGEGVKDRSLSSGE